MELAREELGEVDVCHCLLEHSMLVWHQRCDSLLCNKMILQTVSLRIYLLLTFYSAQCPSFHSHKDF